MLLVDVLTLLLPIVAILSLIAFLPLVIFSRLIFERYEKMYAAFILGLTSQFFLDVAYLAKIVDMAGAYKGFEFLSMAVFIGAMWVVLRNAASIYIVSEANRRLESEVKAKTTELEEKVKELTESRTALINMMEDLDRTHAELQVAYQELKELDRVKSDILSNVSHELRTPITIAKGSIELAMDDIPLKERREILERGKGALMRLNHVVGDLIAVAKMGKIEFVKGQIDIPSIISEAIQEVSALAEEHQVKIENEMKGDLKVAGDADALRRVVYALMDNGIKFNKRGGLVKISAKADGKNVRIIVEDTGIGIPREELDKIFQPLYQVDSSTTRKYPGMGMGLAIVDNYVKAHGGKVLVESEVGKGSKFTVLLPMKQGVEKAREQAWAYGGK